MTWIRFWDVQGCNRSFAELWRLKVHFRAPPDVRGSGKERGHGTELKYCPKCGKELKPGKHHVGCTAGKSAPRQAAKRQKNVSSTSETGDWATASSPSNSLDYDEEVRLARQSMVETAVRRRASRVRRQGSGNAAGYQDCRVDKEFGEDGSNSKEDSILLDEKYHQPLIGEDFDNLPSLLDTADLPLEYDTANLLPDLGKLHDGSRAPSPPPLPLEWDLGPSQPNHVPGLLFDFDQFDESLKRPRAEGSMGQPHMTVTSAMNPSEVSNPSDDYIWQIMFAGADDPIPKRVTAHLHNPFDKVGSPADNLGSIFDDDHLHEDYHQAANQGAGHFPPPPPEVLNTNAGETAQPEKTVTVTYVVKDGQYAVKHVDQAE